MREDKLYELILTLKCRIPKYSEILQNVNVTKENLNFIFESLPIITKKEIKKDYLSFVDKHFPRNEIYNIVNIEGKSFEADYAYEVNGEQIYAEYTSGTTGTPFAAIKTQKERILLGKSLWKNRCAYGNCSPKKMFNFIHNNGQYCFPFPREFSSRQKIKEMNFLLVSEYKWWHIYPNILSSYAHCVIENDLNFTKLEGIESNGAYISCEEKEMYKNIFHCRVINNYGTREFWNIAYEDDTGFLKINPDVVVELVDDDGNFINESNKIGYIVASSLILKTMPFVRYYIGDLAKFVDTNVKKSHIELIPGRNLISGTKIYGNQFFRNIVIDLMQIHKLKRIEFINIKEIGIHKFIVYVIGNQEDKIVLQAKFFECLNYYEATVDSSNWVFEFEYIDSEISKSIFTSVVKP